MKKRKILTVLVFISIVLSGCSNNSQPDRSVYTDEAIDESDRETGISEEIKEISAAESDEKGYDLPIAEAVREEAVADCRAAMEQIRQIYLEADKGDASNAVISKETAGKMLAALKKTGCPVTAGGFYFNMGNYKKLEKFLEDSLKGKAGKLVTYEILLSGDIGRREFIFDGNNMYALDITSIWSERNTPIITGTSYTRIKKWEYTKKGWFVFEYCVPEPPEVTEIVVGTVMRRVKPLKEEYRRISEKYLLPVGYQGNNLFCSDWDAAHMEELDYNGLFQYLYSVKYGDRFEADSYKAGIPKAEFESLMMEYLPVTAEQLKQYAVYDAKSQTYAWEILGCGNYAPKFFGTSIPEITGIKENENGTVTLTVDAVCEMKGKDAVISHKLTVQFLENGSIRYLENQVLGDGLEKIPQYQYRLEK